MPSHANRFPTSPGCGSCSMLRSRSTSSHGWRPAEQGCCTFFAFAITIDDRGIALEVRAPADAADLVTAVFGAPA